ncbi:TnsA endonuclease N-terminal domain-containing protein [Nostoc sp. NIES-2111]
MTTHSTRQPSRSWRPTAPSRASRTISRRSNRSGRVTIVTANDHRRIHCESYLEARVAYVLLARPDVADVSEQPAAVKYRDEDGRSRLHFFDFLVTRRDGTRIAVAVKPAKVARRKNLLALLARIAAQLPPGFADAVLLLTDEDLTPALVANAKMIHSVRRGRDPELDARVAALAAELNGRVTVATLVEVLGAAGEGFRAVVRAVADGILRLVGRGEIGYGTWLEPAPGQALP